MENEKTERLAIYDPNKSYRWEPDQEFKINGRQFAILLNSLRAIISTPEAQNILAADKAQAVLEKVLSNGVESGEVVETEPLSQKT